ncbi:MAG: TRAP transporter small permease [Pseudomonadota bacterium]
MAAASLVLSDDSLVSRLDRALNRIEYITIVIGGITVFSLMILAVVSVGGRNFFNAPLPGYVDWIEQLMPVIAIFGVAYVQREGGHIRMDLLVGRLRGRALWAAEWVTTLAIFILAATLLWGSWTHFGRSFDINMPMWSRDSSIDIGLPVWPAKLVVPVALTILNARLLLQLWAYARAFGRDETHPAALPLIADVATQAAMEADQVSGRDD